MVTNIDIKSKKAALGRMLRKTNRWLASPEGAAAIKLIIATIALVQAVDAYRDSRRRIGFRTSPSSEKE